MGRRPQTSGPALEAAPSRNPARAHRDRAPASPASAYRQSASRPASFRLTQTATEAPAQPPGDRNIRRPGGGSPGEEPTGGSPQFQTRLPTGSAIKRAGWRAAEEAEKSRATSKKQPPGLEKQNRRGTHERAPGQTG